MSLKDLDERLVPRLAAALRSFLDALSGRGAAARERGESLLAGGGALRRLDDRYAARGPLKLLRDVPQLGILVVAIVFLAGTGAALSLRTPETVRVRPPVGATSELALSLGPAVGADIDAHFAAARAQVVKAASLKPEARYLALVSLNKGLTPQQLDELQQVNELELERAYLRAPVAENPEQIVFDTSDDLVDGLRKVFAETAERKAQEQKDLLETAKTIVAGTPEEEAFRKVYEADAEVAGKEAAAYRSDCACVFALVVRAEVGELQQLLSTPLVRGVELAPRGIELGALSIRPLSPTEQGVVSPDSGRPPTDGA